MNMRPKDITLHVFFSWRKWSFTGDLRVVEAAAWSVMEIRNPLAKTSLDLALNSQPSKKKICGFTKHQLPHHRTVVDSFFRLFL